jgi:hypothetical protein
VVGSRVGFAVVSATACAVAVVGAFRMCVRPEMLCKGMTSVMPQASQIHPGFSR